MSLRNQAITINEQLFFGGFDADVLLLKFGKEKLQPCVLLLLRTFNVNLSFGERGLAWFTPREIHANGKHVVVAKLPVRILVRIGEAEIGTKVFSRQCNGGLIALNHRRILPHIRVM